MVDEEKVDKVPSKTSEVPAEVPTDKTSDGAAEIPAEAPANLPANPPAEGVPAETFVCDVCGKSFDTKSKRDGHMSAHSKKSPETIEEDLPDEFLDEQETLDRIIAEATPTRKRKAIVRMVGWRRIKRCLRSW